MVNLRFLERCAASLLIKVHKTILFLCTLVGSHIVEVSRGDKCSNKERKHLINQLMAATTNSEKLVNVEKDVADKACKADSSNLNLSSFDPLSHENKIFQIVGELRLRREFDVSNNSIIQQLTEENFELKMQQKNAEQKCCQIKEENEKHMFEMKKIYGDEVSKIKQEKVKLQVKVDCLQKEVEDIKNEARTIHVEKLTLEKAVSNLKGHIHIHNTLQDNMQNQFNRVNSLTEKLNKTCNELSTKQESLREDVTRATSLRGQIEEINNQYNRKLEDLMQECQSAKKNVTLLRLKLQEASVTPMQENSLKFEELKLQIKHKQDELVALHDILESSRQQNSNKLETLKASHKLVDKYVGLLKETTNEKEEITKKLNTAKKENENLHDQLNKIQTELDEHIWEWRLKELMKSDTSNKASQTNILSDGHELSCKMVSIPGSGNNIKESRTGNETYKSVVPTRLLLDDDHRSNQCSQHTMKHCNIGTSTSVVADNDLKNKGIKNVNNNSCTYLKTAFSASAEDSISSFSSSADIAQQTSCEVHSYNNEDNSSNSQLKLSNVINIEKNIVKDSDVGIMLKPSSSSNNFVTKSLLFCQINSPQKYVVGNLESNDNLYITGNDNDDSKKYVGIESQEEIISTKHKHNIQELFCSKESCKNYQKCLTEQIKLDFHLNSEPIFLNLNDHKIAFSSTCLSEQVATSTCKQNEEIKDIKPVSDHGNVTKDAKKLLDATIYATALMLLKHSKTIQVIPTVDMPLLLLRDVSIDSSLYSKAITVSPLALATSQIDFNVYSISDTACPKPTKERTIYETHGKAVQLKSQIVHKISHEKIATDQKKCLVLQESNINCSFSNLENKSCKIGMTPVCESHIYKFQYNCYDIENATNTKTWLENNSALMSNVDKTLFCKQSNKIVVENNTDSSHYFSIAESFLEPTGNFLACKQTSEESTNGILSDKSTNVCLSENLINSTLMELNELTEPLNSCCKEIIAQNKICPLKPELNSTTNTVAMPLEPNESLLVNKNGNNFMLVTTIENVECNNNGNNSPMISQSRKTEDTHSSFQYKQSSSNVQNKSSFSLSSSSKSSCNKTSLLLGTSQSSVKNFNEAISASYEPVAGIINNTLLGSTSLSSVLSRRNISSDIGKRPYSEFTDIKLMPSSKKSNTSR